MLWDHCALTLGTLGMNTRQLRTGLLPTIPVRQCSGVLRSLASHTPCTPFATHIVTCSPSSLSPRPWAQTPMWPCLMVSHLELWKMKSSVFHLSKYQCCVLPYKQSLHWIKQRFLLTWCLIYLEKAMATHSSTLAWKIPRSEEPGRLRSMGSLRVGHDWATSFSIFTFMRWRRKWQPTPVFLPGESQGWGSLVGCCLWGCTDLDTTDAT